jgi:hypothetical protein
MSGKTVVLKFSEKYGGWWGSWGGETFYDADRCMILWETPQAATGWLAIYHPELNISIEGDQGQTVVYRADNSQLSMF